MIKKERLFSKFKYAGFGIGYLWRHESSFRWQLLIALVVQLIVLVWRPDTLVWALVTFVSAVVLSAEAFNTTLEKLLDIVEPRLLNQVAILKNLLAAAVLLVALGAAMVGVIVFLN